MSEILSCPMCDTLSPWEPRVSPETYEHHGKALPVEHIEYSVCRECGFDVILPDQKRRNDARVRDARRQMDGLLTGQEIRSVREDLGLTQHEAARLIGGGQNAFSKYERGEVTQSVAMDRLLRLLQLLLVYDAVPDAVQTVLGSKSLVRKERVVLQVTVEVAVVSVGDEHTLSRRHDIETVQPQSHSAEAANESNAWSLAA